MKTRSSSHGKKLRTILLSCVSLLFLSLIGLSIYAKILYDGNFSRVEPPKYTALLRYGDVSTYARTEVKFESGKNLLAGYIYGEENQKGLIVISHGLGYGAEDYLAQTIYFVDHGWRVFTFDNTGTYNSQGQGTRGLPKSVLDLDAALTYIQSDPALSTLPVMLFGHSWGGYAVTAVLNYSHPVAGVVSIAGFNSPDGLLWEQAQQMGIAGYLSYPFLKGYQAWLFGDDARLTAVAGINKSNIPVMIIHGTADRDILFSGASIISHGDEISDPNVILITAGAENRNGHKDLWRSEAAVSYINRINQEYKTLFDRYTGIFQTRLRPNIMQALTSARSMNLTRIS